MAELAPEQREAFVEAAEFEELLQCPGWKKLWQFAENYTRQALTDIKNSKSSDPMLRLRLQTVWAERDLFMDALHSHIQGHIDRKKEVIEEVGIAMGASPEQIEQLIEQEEMYGR